MILEFSNRSSLKFDVLNSMFELEKPPWELFLSTNLSSAMVHPNLMENYFK